MLIKLTDFEVTLTFVFYFFMSHSVNLKLLTVIRFKLILENLENKILETTIYKSFEIFPMYYDGTFILYLW